MSLSSVLSSFVFNLLSLIQSATSSIHSFRQQARTGKSEGTLDLWSWEISAKKWCERPDWQMTALCGCVHKVNEKDHRTEPCGLPHVKTGGIDSWPTNTDWVRQLKYEINQSRTVPEQPKVARNLVLRMLWQGSHLREKTAFFTQKKQATQIWKCRAFTVRKKQWPHTSKCV